MTQATNVTIDRDNTKGDVIAQLLAQHELVRSAIDKVAQTKTAAARQRAFDVLRELLARHETAEEMIVRPLTRDLAGGETVASARMEEENKSKDVVAELEKLDVASEGFTRLFETFVGDILSHPKREETNEF